MKNGEIKEYRNIARTMIFGACITSLTLAGCSAVPDKQYQQVGFQSRSCTIDKVGRRADCPATQAGVTENNDGRVERRFSVAFLEYCELESEACKGPGQLFAPNQLQAILQKIENSNTAGEATFVAIYVHGWHHSASPDDENVKYFDHMLARYKDALSRAGQANTQVLGVYVGWRGESISTPVASVFTIANRARAADSIATSGTMASDLADIARAVQKGPTANRMIVTGHSLGGRILSRALLPTFMKTDQPLGEKTLIVTLNAAIGADAYYDLYHDSTRLAPTASTPTWLNITSRDDWTTRRTYPFAHLLGNMHPDHPGDDSSGSTIGHYPSYKTHQISFADCNAVGCGDKNRIAALLTENYWLPAPYHFFVLQYVPESLEAGANTCGLIREYPYNQNATEAMTATGICTKMVGSESPHTGRKQFPANGHLWNIEGDSTVIDTDGLQATGTPVHNATTQTNLATILVRLLYANQ
ncbi:hypothetical protein [Burkholderia sola]|uniref:hypothetical protein n=1 Tax=Burkholderia sola TaxID=2843302 RepID=UPI00338F4D36